MDNLIVIVLIFAILGAAAAYVYKAKKSGQHCIGCPNSRSCPSSKNCSGSCNCSRE